MSQPFVAAAKIETFIKRRNAVRAAIRAEGTPAIIDAWSKFEGFTDCISMEQAEVKA